MSIQRSTTPYDLSRCLRHKSEQRPSLSDVTPKHVCSYSLHTKSQPAQFISLNKTSKSKSPSRCLWVSAAAPIRHGGDHCCSTHSRAAVFLIVGSCQNTHTIFVYNTHTCIQYTRVYNTHVSIIARVSTIHTCLHYTHGSTIYTCVYNINMCLQ